MYDTVVWSIIFAIVVAVAWYHWPKADVDKDGDVDAKDAKKIAKDIVDVNNDGAVDKKDAKAVARKVKRTTTKVVKNVKSRVEGKTE